MGFRPMPDEDKAIESTLIWYRSGTENGNWKDWTGRLDAFLAGKQQLVSPFASANTV
jgi:hypothetical protein